MTTAKELNGIFDVVEELVGTYPSADALRNALHAVITPSLNIPRTGGFHIWRKFDSPNILDNIEYLARNYETLRGSHMHLNVTSYSNSKLPEVYENGLCGAECNQP